VPTYTFYCKACFKEYSDLQPFDPTGKYKKVKCPNCNSKKKSQTPTVPKIKFTNPKDTSKFDNFSYRAGYNLEKAQDLRRAAESESHMGSDPYHAAGVDDISSGNHFGEVE
jgi:DNA-directed RNA polymerase subunit RPC12/RpoP